MAHILKLPNELLDKIVQELEYGEEVSNLSQTCHRLYGVASHRIYPGYAMQYTPTALSRIVTTGNVDSLRKLLKSGISFRRYSAMTGYNSPLPEAVESGQIEIAKLLIETYGTEITSGSLSDIETAVNAVGEGLFVILQLLVQNGLSKHGALQALIRACEESQLSTIRYLVSELRIDVNARGDHDITAIKSAAMAGRLEVVEYLVEAGATIDDLLQEASLTHRSVLYEATWHEHVDVVRFLLEKGASVREFTADELRNVVKLSQDRVALIFERIGRRKIMNKLKYVSVKTRAAYLVVAAALGDEVMFAKLLRLGAGPVDSSATELLDYAASNGNQTIVMTLFDILGKNPDNRSLGYMNAIFAALKNNHDNLVVAILDHCGYARIATEGLCWLIEAAKERRDSICLMLIKRGALKFFPPSLKKKPCEMLRAAWNLGYQIGKRFDGSMAVLRQIHRNLSHDFEYSDKVTCGVLSGVAGFCDAETFKLLMKRYRRLRDYETDLETWGKTLSSAVRERNKETIPLILQKAEPNYPPTANYCEDFPPIIVLCGYRVIQSRPGSVDVCLDIIRQVLDHGAWIDDYCSKDDPALNSVTSRGDYAIEIAKELIKHGADPLVAKKQDPSPLELAFEGESPKLVELFLHTLEKRDTLAENWSLIERQRSGKPRLGIIRCCHGNCWIPIFIFIQARGSHGLGYFLGQQGCSQISIANGIPAIAPLVNSLGFFGSNSQITATCESR